MYIWRLFALGRRRQRDDAKHARAHALGDRLDRAALAGAVAPSKTMQTLSPLCTTHCCSLTSSTCSRSSSLVVVLALQIAGLRLVRLFSRSFCLRVIVVASGLLLVFERLGGDLAVEADQSRHQRLEFRIPRGEPLGDAGVLEHELEEMQVLIGPIVSPRSTFCLQRPARAAAGCVLSRSRRVWMVPASLANRS